MTMLSFWIYTVLISVLLLTKLGFTFCQTLNQSKTLMNQLLNEYDKRHRPIINQSEWIDVHIEIEILALVDVDEVTEQFSTSAVMYVGWYDNLIYWDPDLHDGITSMNFPVTEVWYPNLHLANPSSEFKRIIEDWMSVHIDYTGLIDIATDNVFEATCSIDVTYYPFDVQKCTLVFVPFGYNYYEIQLYSGFRAIKFNGFISNGEWKIKRYYHNQVEEAFNTTILYFTFELERKSLLLVVNILLPIFLMSIMNCSTFLLPTSSGERVSYAVSVKLAFGVFFTLISENLPKKSVPMSMMLWFLLALLIISACTCAMAIISTTLYHKENTEPVPKWIAHIVETLSCLTFKHSCKTGRVNHFDAENKAGQNKGAMDYEGQKGTQDDNKKVERDKSAELKCDMTNLKDERMTEDKSITWQIVSETLDTVCLVIVTVATAICIITYIVLIPLRVSNMDESITQDYLYETTLNI